MERQWWGVWGSKSVKVKIPAISVPGNDDKWRRQPFIADYGNESTKVRLEFDEVIGSVDAHHWLYKSFSGENEKTPDVTHILGILDARNMRAPIHLIKRSFPRNARNQFESVCELFETKLLAPIKVMIIIGYTWRLQPPSIETLGRLKLISWSENSHLTALLSIWITIN